MAAVSRLAKLGQPGTAHLSSGIVGRREKMNRCMCPVRLVLTALVLLVLAPPGGAQQSTQDLVPFKAVVQQSPLNTPVAIIPGNTPLSVSILKMTGQADFMGAVTYIELHPAQVGVDGKGFGVNNAVGALTAANGDELYLTYHGVVHPTATGADAEFALTITGGKGRFAGAIGSGFVKGGVDRPNNTVTIAIDAMISRPKP
jgi:hypothetical protein